MILTFKKSESLGDVYLLKLDRTIKYKDESNDAAPIDIVNFLENHYKGKYKECENLEVQEIDDGKLDRYISSIEKSYSVEQQEWSVGIDDGNDFYKNRELIHILVKLEPDEEKSFIATLKMYMGDKNLSYVVDS